MKRSRSEPALSFEKARRKSKSWKEADDDEDEALPVKEGPRVIRRKKQKKEEPRIEVKERPKRPPSLEEELKMMTTEQKMNQIASSCVSVLEDPESQVPYPFF
jgi:hypothetical protein